MALNNSGPISLGGATVGQSINLELGQAATALSSINATNARTLAGVPSGMIALSNFYGKSANSYWAITASIQTLYRGFAASVNGILVVGNGATSGEPKCDQMYYFNADGGYIKGVDCKSYYSKSSAEARPSSVQGFTNNNSASAPIFYPNTQDNFYTPYGFAAFNYSNNTNAFTSNYWRWTTSTGYFYDGARQAILADASGNIYVVPRNPTQYSGKYTANQTAYASFDSAGNARYAYCTSGSNYAPTRYQNSNFAGLRSDNVLVVFGANTSTSLGFYTVNTSTGVQIISRDYTTSGCDTGKAQVMVDASNNIYIARPNSNSLPKIFKLDSAYNVVAAKYYTPTSGASAQAGFWSSAALYGSTIYILTTSGVANGLSVVAVDTATMLPTWTLNIAFTGIDSLGSDFMQYGQSAIRATAVGVYIMTRINKSGNYNTCIMKLPLDGNISGAKTVALRQGSNTCTATFSRVTSGDSSFTAADTTFTYVTNVTLPNVVSKLGNGNTGQAPIGTTTPDTSTSTF